MNRGRRGSSLLEVTISAAVLAIVFGLALSSYQATLGPAARLRLTADQVSNNASAVHWMNTELQEASVEEATVEIFRTVLADGTLADPVRAADLPPGETAYPRDQEVERRGRPPSFAIRFRTIGRYRIDEDSGGIVAIAYRGPVIYRLGTGAPDDYPTDRLLRLVDPDGEAGPLEPVVDRVLCKDVVQAAFQRDARGGSIIATVVTRRSLRDGQTVRIPQRLRVTPRNNFGSNLQNEADT